MDREGARPVREGAPMRHAWIETDDIRKGGHTRTCFACGVHQQRSRRQAWGRYVGSSFWDPLTSEIGPCNPKSGAIRIERLHGEAGPWIACIHDLPLLRRGKRRRFKTEAGAKRAVLREALARMHEARTAFTDAEVKEKSTPGARTLPAEPPTPTRCSVRAMNTAREAGATKQASLPETEMRLRWR